MTIRFPTPRHAQPIRTTLLLAAAITAAACILVLAPAPARACPPIDILVPAYQYPTVGSMWATLAVPPPAPPPGSAATRITVILNPNSGPGAQVDPFYTAAVQGARAAGARIVGYVATGYGTIPQAAVLAQVQTYMTFYGIDGVFLDELDNTPPPSGALAYSQQLTASIHAMLPGSMVIGNPGTSVPEVFIAQSAADVLVTYENDRLGPAEPYSTTPPPSWVFAYPAARFAHIIYNTPDAATMRGVLALARARNVGMVYVTEDMLPNPYDTLAGYWTAQLAAAAGCAADIDCSGTLTVQDIFDFLAAWFGGAPAGDFNHIGGITVQDIFDFLAAWFQGC